MATPLNTILNYFKTGLKPTQAQFWAAWSSFRHKDDPIPAADVQDLQALLDAKADKSTDIVVDASTLESYDPTKLEGYLAGNVFVSYQNAFSTDPDLDFKELFIYQCVADAAIGESPETHPAKWTRIGKTMTYTSSSTCNGWVGLSTHLYALTGMRNDDTVAVLQFNAVYKYSTATGTWNYFCELKPVILQTTGTSTTAVMSQKAVTDLAETKVDKVAGKSLVSDSEIARLAGINEHFRGSYLSKAALDLAVPIANAGDEATVDAGVGSDPIKYIWDISDNAWKQGGGGSVTVDQSVINGSTNAVSGGAVYNAFTALKDGVVTAGDTLKKLYDLILGKASKPANPTLGRVHYSDANGNVVETDYGYDEVLQTSAIDYSQPAWMVGESRLLLTKKLSSTEGNFEGAAELMDLFLPPEVLTTLESNDSNWINETKIVTGDNSTYALGRTGQFGWLSDRTFVQCTSASYAVSGSATFNRNRAVDALNIADTQDLAVINLLEPSRTGGTDDDGWNLTTQTKLITTVPCKVGTYWVGGTNGDGNWFTCFAQSGTSYYWKRLGTPASIQRPITTVSHPTLTGRLLAKADWASSLYTVQSGDETSYQDQTFWDTATRAYYIKVTTTQWEKIK